VGEREVAVESELDELRAQGERIRALEGQASALPAPDVGDRPDPTRRQLFRLAGAAAAGGVAAGLAGATLGATPAGAANGDNLILGQQNVASSETRLDGVLRVDRNTHAHG
jgi:hypothetical protein